jgi:hypothetical protein
VFTQQEINMTPKDMPAFERRARDQRWSGAVDFGSPMSAWSTTMLEVRRDMGQPQSVADVQQQMAEVRRRDAAEVTCRP